jgi:hypothetical protein
MWGLSFGYLFTLSAVIGLLALFWMLSPEWSKKLARKQVHWTCTVVWSVVFTTMMAVGGLIFAAMIATTATAVVRIFLVLSPSKKKEKFPYHRKRYRQFKNTVIY